MKVKEVSEKVGLNLTFRKLRSWQIDGETMKTVKDFILQAPKSLQIVTAAMKLMLSPWKKIYNQPRQRIKKQRHQFANKSWYSPSYGFSSSRVWMQELDYKEG